MEEEKLLEAIENIRRDKNEPWRYILFTFLNGIAQGLGVALGMTLLLGIVVYLASMLVARMIDFPVVGRYFQEIGKLIDVYVKSAPKIH
ncbi:MAG: hypothetical protein FD145_1076 [Candidatus Saganbacteria bacterium]|uniref:Uncharacterized protein n=1 Tax=Candidatus Saganbacteria bacterium TaxID=2575572 RepID=A0A833P311_UNCSA|nr:MAG: hypothetical protein FD145_1076 [Candidatus Saganbacteria bacterium]